MLRSAPRYPLGARHVWGRGGKQAQLTLSLAGPGLPPPFWTRGGACFLVAAGDLRILPRRKNEALLSAFFANSQ